MKIVRANPHLRAPRDPSTEPRATRSSLTARILAHVNAAPGTARLALLLLVASCNTDPPPVRWPHMEAEYRQAQEDPQAPELMLTRADYWETNQGGVLEEHLFSTRRPNPARAEYLLRGRHALLSESVPEAARFELFLYDSLARSAAEQGLWCALLVAERDGEILVEVDAEYLALAEEPVGARFGLEESARIEIWGRLVEVERSSHAQAVAQYPSAAELLQQLELEEQLLDTARNQIGQSYRLSEAELTALRLEAVQRKWPMPAPHL